jgi:hypothetical protein
VKTLTSAREAHCLEVYWHLNERVRHCFFTFFWRLDLEKKASVESIDLCFLFAPFVVTLADGNYGKHSRVWIEIAESIIKSWRTIAIELFSRAVSCECDRFQIKLKSDSWGSEAVVAWGRVRCLLCFCFHSGKYESMFFETTGNIRHFYRNKFE